MSDKPVKPATRTAPTAATPARRKPVTATPGANAARTTATPRTTTACSTAATTATTPRTTNAASTAASRTPIRKPGPTLPGVPTTTPTRKPNPTLPGVPTTALAINSAKSITNGTTRASIASPPGGVDPTEFRALQEKVPAQIPTNPLIPTFVRLQHDEAQRLLEEQRSLLTVREKELETLRLQLAETREAAIAREGTALETMQEKTDETAGIVDDLKAKVEELTKELDVGIASHKSMHTMTLESLKTEHASALAAMESGNAHIRRKHEEALHEAEREFKIAQEEKATLDTALKEKDDEMQKLRREIENVREEIQ
ncbi:hypothetical protein BC936DRAFT_136996, partial [Jimgerdemannia flammicorona]